MTHKENFLSDISHMYKSWSWVTYFGFEVPWVADNKCTPYKSMSFFDELRKGGCIFHCMVCALQIIPLRLITTPITLLRDLVSRWIWRSKYTESIRLELMGRYKEKKEIEWKSTT